MRSLQRTAVPKKHAPASLAVVINPTGDFPGSEREGKLLPPTTRARAHRPGARQGHGQCCPKGVERQDALALSASHGTFSWQDARQSALIMHGKERLSVGRLLDAEGSGRPRLVVLSACETGLYDLWRNPDQFIGLPGTFTALGAAGVLGTLWPVSDAATALLIARFYEQYWNANLTPPAACSTLKLGCGTQQKMSWMLSPRTARRRAGSSAVISPRSRRT